MATGNDANWGKFLSVGFEVAAGVGLGAFVGYQVDKHLHSGPWGVVAGTLLGVAGGMYLMIREVLRMNKD